MEQKTSEFDKVLGAWDILVIELISDEDAASLMPEADDEELDVVIDAAIDRVLSSMA